MFCQRQSAVEERRPPRWARPSNFLSGKPLALVTTDPNLATVLPE